MHNSDASIAVYRDDHPIEKGFTLLEASAGTGKTYSLTFLYLRLLLEEGLKPDEIVVVTFTNAAAAELRERIHERIAQAETILRAQNTPEIDENDPEIQKILGILARATDGNGRETADILQTLKEARGMLDTSVISTIHSFAGRLGEEFSTITGTPSGATLVDNLHNILNEVILDLEHQLAEDFPDAAELLVQKDGKIHETVRDIARTLLDNPDVQAPPDELFYLPIQDALEHIRNDEALFADGADLAESLVSQSRDFLQWFVDEGEAKWLKWYEDLRELKAINGNSIRRPSVQNAFDAVRETHRMIENESNIGNALATIIKTLDTGGRNNGHLRFFSFNFLSQRHKNKDIVASSTPTGQDIPASSLKVDAILRLSEVLASDGFHNLWAFHVAKKAAQLTSERAAVKGVRSHAHVISDIANALRGERRDELVGAVQKRYRAALIDEFQDTDKEQWAIFQALFDPSHAFTYLIGDPKQAIYGFRGANVAVYESVRRDEVDSDRIMSLDTNYRSDAQYNDAINQVFGKDSDATFDAFVTVKSPDRDPTRRLKLSAMKWPSVQEEERVQITGGDPSSALVVRYLCGLRSAEFQQRCADNIAREIVFRLNHSDENQIHADGAWRAIQPRDCAVIVRSRAQAETIVTTLQQAGVPAVMRDHQSVALSDAADGLMHWLSALDDPGNARAIRAFLFSPIVGMPIDQLDVLDEEALTGWAEFFGETKQNWNRFGLHASFRATLHRPLFDASPFDASQLNGADDVPDVMSNLLSRDGGIRIAGDLMHLIEVLNTAQRRERLSIAGLQDWFARARYTEDNNPGGIEEFKRRIATDDEAVEVVTAHSSKGLEYPLVWTLGLTSGNPRPNFLFDPEDATHRFASTETMLSELKKFGEANPNAAPLSAAQLEAYRTILQSRYPSINAPILNEDADALAPDDLDAAISVDEAVKTSVEYAAGEDLRLLYVALTRARLRTVIYVDASSRGGDKELTFARKTKAAEETSSWEPSPLGVGGLERPSPWPEGTLSIEQWMKSEHELPPLPNYHPHDAPPRDELNLRTPPIVQQTRSQRPSFSSLLRLLPDHFGYFQNDGDLDIVNPEDEALSADRFLSALEDDPLEVIDEMLTSADVPDALPLTDYASGREAGTAMHAVFELIEFEGAKEQPVSDKIIKDIKDQANEALVNNGIDPAGQADILQRGVLAALQTPFGGVLEDFCLADLPRKDRIDELQFFMPLGEGQESTTASAIFSALRTRRGDGGIEEEWFDDLGAGMANDTDLHGLMIGFIDLVFRAEVDGRPQYFISDYKSNRLAARDEVITSSTFTQNAVRNEMRQHHYYLQYHLYLVALHRWLGTRLPDYDYDTHVGGAYYLFVRGMEGADTPSDDGYSHGVFFDRPPKAVIEALDQALIRSQQHRDAEAGR